MFFSLGGGGFIHSVPLIFVDLVLTQMKKLVDKVYTYSRYKPLYQSFQIEKKAAGNFKVAGTLSRRDNDSLMG